MENLSILDAIVNKHEFSYHCSICGSEIDDEDVPFGANFLICDECKEAIKYAKTLMKNNLKGKKEEVYGEQ